MPRLRRNGLEMRKDAEKIYTGAIKACLPDAAVRAALSELHEVKFNFENDGTQIICNN